MNPTVMLLLVSSYFDRGRWPIIDKMISLAGKLADLEGSNALKCVMAGVMPEQTRHVSMSPDIYFYSRVGTLASVLVTGPCEVTNGDLMAKILGYEPRFVCLTSTGGVVPQQRHGTVYRDAGYDDPAESCGRIIASEIGWDHPGLSLCRQQVHVETTGMTLPLARFTPNRWTPRRGDGPIVAMPSTVHDVTAALRQIGQTSLMRAQGALLRSQAQR